MLYIRTHAQVFDDMIERLGLNGFSIFKYSAACQASWRSSNTPAPTCWPACQAGRRAASLSVSESTYGHFRHFNQDKGLGSWSFGHLKGTFKPHISQGSRIRDPRSEMSHFEYMRIDCSCDLVACSRGYANRTVHQGAAELYLLSGLSTGSNGFINVHLCACTCACLYPRMYL